MSVHRGKADLAISLSRVGRGFAADIGQSPNGMCPKNRFEAAPGLTFGLAGRPLEYALHRSSDREGRGFYP